ncbi:hypothetical protein VHEMI07541 [[Torrubiella] hemipterigena]|uniref:AMMECR1 domain-containing protein n=1 Tax=[Torrubiella] hemipterigena TaxID=1531966 RepID=A0A0A1TLV2_9HYPO|nr:hypothetical protein VHEMI07541 [[Torrubiella] hemipterigena]
MATKAHCLLCFETLDAELNKREARSLDQITASWALYSAARADRLASRGPAYQRLVSGDASSGSSSSTSLAPSTATTSVNSTTPVAPSSAALFVTWNTVEDLEAAVNENGEDDAENLVLRGCIGTFEPMDLDDGLSEYAVISAFHDTRFRPIRQKELATLQNAVTLLTDFEPVEDPMDWEVGKHGVRLAFTDRGRRYGSTYLPDVAAEQGWTKDETLLSLMRKAGWSGNKAAWKDVPLKVTRYQGKKMSMRYEEFKKWQDWEDHRGDE